MFEIFPLKDSLSKVEGFFCDGVSVGLKSDGGEDVAFIRSEKPCLISSVFTKNSLPAAPIKHYRRYPKDFKTDFILINSKNANAMTGKKGIEDIRRLFEILQKKIPLTNPVMSSTGVIGYRLPVSKIASSFEKFDFNAKNSNKAAKAIMTTDSFEKELGFKVELEEGKSFQIAGICKGAGMINPSMATMLCFIVTDAAIEKEDMDELLKESVDRSFNNISVDGDMSTNDTVMLLSSQKSGAYDKEAFAYALNLLTYEFSMMILKDGEGSNKVVAFEVKGAKSKDEAKKISKNLSNSLLVKTALFGEDPNWGRIASTIGASVSECDEEKLTIKYDDLVVYSKESPTLDKEKEKLAVSILEKESFKISCDLGIGEFSHTSYGCDLSYDYVKINADYRT